MEIIFQFRDKVYSISIGYKTVWFFQTPFFMYTRLWFDNGTVSFAKCIWSS